MLTFLCSMPILWQIGLLILALLGGFKAYLMYTLGVCTSTKKLTGKTVIITGANTGIGKETAIDLAKRGARIILACRDLKKAAIAKDDIVRESGNKNVVIRQLDLASLKSVRKFAADILKSELRLDILINNAGCATIEKTLTEDGLEYQMQSNHFGHFLLTNLLLGLIIQTGTARIINVSSKAHRMPNPLDLDDLTFDRNPADQKMLRIYGVTKLCNILFSKELAKKLKPFGLLKKSAPSRIIHVSSMAHAFTKTLDLNNLNSELSYNTGTVYYYSKLSQVLCTRHLAPLISKSGVTVNCLHPGAVQTEIFRNAPSCKNITVNALHPGAVHTEFSRFLPYEMFKKIMAVVSPFISKSAKEGAQTTIHLAVADEVANVTGEYFSDCKIAKTTILAKDAGLAKKLWEVSETLVKLRPEERHC